MRLPKRFWDGVAEGSVTLAFRHWRRPTVKAGGTLHSPVGLVAIKAVERVARSSITAADAHAAGYATKAQLLADLAKYERPDTTLHRIAFHYAGEDPRRALREDSALGDDAVAMLRARLARMDRQRPWTREVLELIRDRPETLAADLAASLGREKLAFKADVRRLKALGLTESLPVGYRLSPRGRALLERL